MKRGVGSGEWSVTVRTEGASRTVESRSPHPTPQRWATCRS
jgi:hypothetical protein